MRRRVAPNASTPTAIRDVHSLATDVHSLSKPVPWDWVSTLAHQRLALFDEAREQIFLLRDQRIASRVIRRAGSRGLLLDEIAQIGADFCDVFIELFERRLFRHVAGVP